MKRFLTVVTLLALFAGLASGCGRAARRGQDLISRGDYTSAIETLAQDLARRPDDKNTVPLFTQVYPSHPERLLARVEQLSQTADEDPAAAERMIAAYEELIRIQRAVTPVPGTIGEGSVNVTKFDQDFPGLLEQTKTIAAQAYYDQAAGSFPGTTRQEKERLLELYKNVIRHAPGFRDTHERGAQLSYEIAEELQAQDSISSLEQATNWYSHAQQWVSGYRDTNQRLPSIRYELGARFKAQGTPQAYQRAAAFFQAAGNYRNAPAEVQLFQFFNRVNQLPSEATSDSGAKLRTTGRAAGVKVEVEEQPRTMQDPFTKRRLVKAESSAFSIFDPRADTVFIGAIVDGQSVADQTFRPILADRAPLDITIDLANIAGEATTTIPNPARYSNAQQAIRRLVTQGTTDTIPVRAEFRSVEVQSQENLDLALGVGVNKGTISFGSQTDIATSSERTSTLIELTQIYYTVNIDIPSTPAAFFSTEGNNVVSAGLLSGTTPYYVSQISYGRRGYFLIESDLNTHELQQQIEVAKSIAEDTPAEQGVKVDTSITRRLQRANTRIRSHVIGGSGRNAVITNLEGMMRWIHDGMDASSNLGVAVPVGFVMRSMKDNGIAVVEQAGEVMMPARAMVTVRPTHVQFTRGNNPRALMRLYLSGGRMTPNNPNSDPNRTRDGAGWVVSLNNGSNSLGIGNANLNRRVPIEAQAYSTPVASGDERIYFAANLGDQAIFASAFGRTAHNNTWAGAQTRQLTVNDVINKTQRYQDLATNGWRFDGPDFTGRYFFDIQVELLDD